MPSGCATTSSAGRPLWVSSIPAGCRVRGGVAGWTKRCCALPRRLAAAESVAVFEDLGVQMNRHSTMNSWLEKLLWVLTGNFAKPGSQYMPSSLVSLIRSDGPNAEQAVAGQGQDHQRAGAVQCDSRRDPHRAPGPLPGDAGGERQPAALAGRTRLACVRRCRRSTCWW